MSPNVINENGFRFFFYSNEHLPIHIHVEKENKTAKFEIEEVKLIKNKGFNESELRKIYDLVNKNKTLIKQKWNEFYKK